MCVNNPLNKPDHSTDWLLLMTWAFLSSSVVISNKNNHPSVIWNIIWTQINTHGGIKSSFHIKQHEICEQCEQILIEISCNSNNFHCHYVFELHAFFLVCFFLMYLKTFHFFLLGSCYRDAGKKATPFSLSVVDHTEIVWFIF